MLGKVFSPMLPERPRPPLLLLVALLALFAVLAVALLLSVLLAELLLLLLLLPLLLRLAISCLTTVSNVRLAAAIQPAYKRASIPNCICCCSYSGRLSNHILPMLFPPDFFLSLLLLALLFRWSEARSVPSTSIVASLASSADFLDVLPPLLLRLVFRLLLILLFILPSFLLSHCTVKLWL